MVERTMDGRLKQLSDFSENTSPGGNGRDSLFYSKMLEYDLRIYRM